jgi:hypothetical protein
LNELLQAGSEQSRLAHGGAPVLLEVLGPVEVIPLEEVLVPPLPGVLLVEPPVPAEVVARPVPPAPPGMSYV